MPRKENIKLKMFYDISLSVVTANNVKMAEKKISPAHLFTRQ